MKVDVKEGTPGVSQDVVDLVIALAEKINVTVRRMDSDWERLNVHLGGSRIDGSPWSGGVALSIDTLEKATRNQREYSFVANYFSLLVTRSMEATQ